MSDKIRRVSKLKELAPIGKMDDWPIRIAFVVASVPAIFAYVYAVEVVTIWLPAGGMIWGLVALIPAMIVFIVVGLFVGVVVSLITSGVHKLKSCTQKATNESLSHSHSERLGKIED